MTQINHLLYAIGRYTLGSVFVFSGLIKLNDPIGTAIKLEEYFAVFTYDVASFFQYLAPAAKEWAFFVILLELVLGAALLMGRRQRVTLWVVVGLLVFFSFLTFYSAYFNKVTDCGCFGDAIKLTPWQSFTKDLLLLSIAVPLLWASSRTEAAQRFTYQDAALIGIVGVAWLLGAYAVWHLPYIDFRSYRVGSDLVALSKPSGMLQFAYIMEKDGKEETLYELPKDTAYHFIGTTMLNPDVLPKIPDYALWHGEEDGTEASFSGTKLFIVVQHAIQPKFIQEATALSTQCSGVATPWVVASLEEEALTALLPENLTQVPRYFADATVLKTIIRAPLGYVLLSNGVVKGKWSMHDAPSIATLEDALRE